MVKLIMSLVIAAAVVCTYWSIRFAAADWLAQREQLPSALRAVALASGDEAYLRETAQLADESNGDGAFYYQQAVKANPYASYDWNQLGLHAERAHQFKQAETDLLTAAHYDNLFEPRWALANYYFRRGDMPAALRWIRKSLEIADIGFPGIFRLCWEISSDPAIILHDAVPDRPLVLAQYLLFLGATNRLDAATPVALRLLPIAGSEQVGPLLNYCDAAIAAGRVNDSISVWNGLSERKLIARGPVTSNGQNVVVNSGFEFPPSGRGFDWRLTNADGVLIYPKKTGGLVIDFAGKQPENCVILSQYLQLKAGVSYRLHIKYQTSGISPASGLRWRILDASNGRETPDVSLNLPSEKDQDGYLSFSVPPNVNFEILQLIYERRLGTTRIEGTLNLDQVEITSAP